MKKDIMEEYLKRSTYFYKKTNEFSYESMWLFITQLPIRWIDDDRKRIGVSQKAWEKVALLGIHPYLIFIKPEHIQEHPFLLTYYRSICCLSQKGMGAFGLPNPKLYEERQKKLSSKVAIRYSEGLNKYMSRLIEDDIIHDENQLQTAFYTSVGAQIDGSWRNVIGGNAEKKMIAFLLHFYHKNDQIAFYIDKKGNYDTCSEPPAPFLFWGKDKTYKGFALKTGNRIIFGSEPDVSFFNCERKLQMVFEIKGGKDKAGALERYGAAKKSFQEAKRESENCQTFLFMDSITDEVKKRMEKDDDFTNSFPLNNIQQEEALHQLLLNQ